MPDASPPHDPPAAGPPGPPVAGDSPASGGDRLRRLFRHTLGSGLINPLMHLVARYRAEAPS